MGIHKIMTNALRAEWALTDDFQIYLFNKHLNIDGIQGFTSQDILDMCVINVDIPTMQAEVPNTLVAGAWRVHAAKFQPFTLSVTFRDLSGLRIRERFTEVWMAQQRQYFDDIKSEIRISINQSDVFSSDNLLITSVSQSQLDNNNTQAVEFTVEFVSPTFSNQIVKDFGKFGAWSQKERR